MARRYVKRLNIRLAPDDIDAMAGAFLAGTPKWQLAEQYGVSLSSVKRLFHVRGIRRPGKWNK
jgi:hypothetical protein